MKGFRQLIFIFLLSFASSVARSQQDSCNVRISLLTCGPGEDLYSVFGHSALRVKDFTAGPDIIFNYGTFDFDDPDFYINFIQGKLLYYVSVERFDMFRREYTLENRSIIEQELSLTCEEKERLYSALRINAREENRYYRYQFFFDNCSSRLRDIVRNNTNDSIRFKNILPSNPPTFRDMIHAYLDAGNKPWSEFGIDLVLASRIDRKVKNQEAMFLPDYLMKGFDSSLLRNTSMVLHKKTILESNPSETDNELLTPLTITIALLLFGILLTFINTPWAQRGGNIFDITYFLILGVIGSFMLFMWFGTEHDLCGENYNVLWALPTHLVMSFFIQKKSRLVRNYFAVSAIIAVLFLLLLPVIPQGLNLAFLPLILLSAVRGAYRAFKNNTCRNMR